MKALANENRLLILCELLDGERCVNEMEKVVGLSQSALSQHLALLRRDKLVNTRRDGKTICYSLSGRETPIVLEMLYRMFSPDERESDRNELRKRRGEKSASILDGRGRRDERRTRYGAPAEPLSAGCGGSASSDAGAFPLKKARPDPRADPVCRPFRPR